MSLLDGEGANKLVKTEEPTMKVVLSFLAAGLVGLASPAAADWQFTKWGMTPEQVVKKSPAAVTKVRPEEQDKPSLTTEKGMLKLLEGEWKSGVFRFHVSYQFDAGRHLSAVDLEILDDSQALDVANALSQRYGKPESQDDSGIIMSRNWTTPGETIEFLGPLLPFVNASGAMEKGFHGKVIYVSRKAAAANGL